jgi:hypothetical protein
MTYADLKATYATYADLKAGNARLAFFSDAPPRTETRAREQRPRPRPQRPGTRCRSPGDLTNPPT